MAVRPPLFNSAVDLIGIQHIELGIEKNIATVQKPREADRCFWQTKKDKDFSFTNLILYIFFKGKRPHVGCYSLFTAYLDNDN